MLTAGVTGQLGDVTYVTKDYLAPLVARFPGVVEVIGLKSGESVGSLAARVPQVDAVLDLHSSPRSRALCARIGGPVQRLDKRRMERWLRVAWKREVETPSVLARYAQTCGVVPAAHPWIALDRSGADALGLVPGAAHPTKGWEVERFVAVGRRWSGPVVVLGGPGEEALVESVVAAVRAGGGAARGVAERGFEATFEALSQCKVVVAGDTGLLHLAAACGVPVVGIFGPTTSSDGFWCHPGEAVEAPLPCRPCSRFGGQRCPIGDHLCMTRVSAEQVSAAVERLA